MYKILVLLWKFIAKSNGFREWCKLLVCHWYCGKLVGLFSSAIETNLRTLFCFSNQIQNIIRPFPLFPEPPIPKTLHHSLKLVDISINFISISLMYSRNYRARTTNLWGFSEIGWNSIWFALRFFLSFSENTSRKLILPRNQDKPEPEPTILWGQPEPEPEYTNQHQNQNQD